MLRESKIAVIVAAAGKSRRMGENINKQFLNIEDRPVLAHTLGIFSKLDFVDEIVLVCQDGDISFIRENIIEKYRIRKVNKIVVGGETREDSVYRGLKAIGKDIDIVISHDGARPFVKKEQILESVEVAIDYGACILGVPVKDTIKMSKGDIVDETLDRSKLWAIQTPQTFQKDLLVKAYDTSFKNKNLGTDDSFLVEAIGTRVKIIRGDYNNIKITTPEDISLANSIARNRREEEMKIGIGYDVHNLVENRKLIIGGAEIPFERGLMGHSDADVLVHAIMDSILGGLGLGDIGYHFPDTDMEYKDISSLELLRRVYNIMDREGYRIGNIDSVVMAERPKLLPYIETMRENISKVLMVDKEKVNIKATTTEKLGFVGREEGIAAQATCLLLNKN